MTRMRWLNVATLVAAVLTVPTTLLPLGGLLWILLNWAVWLVFVFELIAAPRWSGEGWQWFRHHKLDVALVVLVPPVVPFVGILRSLRILRLVKILRAGAAIYTGASEVAEYRRKRAEQTV